MIFNLRSASNEENQYDFIPIKNEITMKMMKMMMIMMMIMMMMTMMMTMMMMMMIMVAMMTMMFTSSLIALSLGGGGHTRDSIISSW